MKRSKKYKEAASKLQAGKKYSVEESSKLVKEISYSKFDASIDLIMRLGLKDKQKKESVKGTIVFPNLIGTAPRVAVIADGADINTAKEAGADHAGFDDLVKKIEGGWTEFDVLIATPKVMPQIAKLGKVIGKMGLMPNPRNETVTTDVAKAVKNYKSGKSSFKMVQEGVFQVRFAKAKMTDAQIAENLKAILKGIYEEIKKFGDDVIKDISIVPSMGPRIRLDVKSAISEIA